MKYSQLTDTEKSILTKFEEIDRITNQINEKSYDFLLELKRTCARSETNLETITPEKQERINEGLSQILTELESTYTHLKLMACDEYYGTRNA